MIFTICMCVVLSATGHMKLESGVRNHAVKVDAKAVRVATVDSDEAVAFWVYNTGKQEVLVCVEGMKPKVISPGGAVRLLQFNAEPDDICESDRKVRVYTRRWFGWRFQTSGVFSVYTKR